MSDDDEKYLLFINIIKSGLLHGKADNGKGSTMVQVDPKNEFSSNNAYNPNIVCFCDIPVTDFDIHMDKYSRFGIAFSKEFLIKRGTRPVYYIPRGASGVYGNISELFNRNIKIISNINYNYTMEYVKYITSAISDKTIQQENIQRPELLDLFQFIDMQILSFIKFYDDVKSDDDIDNYYMEREWRCLERIEFEIGDIKRIILPASYIKKFFADIPEYNSYITTV